MDTFQGCYKDGTNGSRDCRWFAGLYLFFRILIIILVIVTFPHLSLPLLGCTVLVVLSLTAVFQPYKDSVHNRINIFFLVLIVFLVFSAMARYVAVPEIKRFKYIADVMIALSCSVPVVYIVAVVLYKLFAHRMWVRKLRQRLCRIFIKPEEEDFVRMLPERMVNMEECAALLADPMEVDTYGYGEDVTESTN